MLTLMTGKRRVLQQCTTLTGALAVLTLDHRNNLPKALHREGDVLKAQFPLDTAAYPDEQNCCATCNERSAASVLRSVLLSTSVNFDTYLRHVRIACESGAPAIAAGRAVWKEASKLSGVASLHFLCDEATRRMCHLCGLCDVLACPWTEFFEVLETGAAFYATY